MARGQKKSKGDVSSKARAHVQNRKAKRGDHYVTEAERRRRTKRKGSGAIVHF